MAAIDQLLCHAAREVQLPSALTPANAQTERSRLTAEVRAGRRPRPRWSYLRNKHDGLRRALDAAERMLSCSTRTALDRVYLARVRELSVEAALCAAAGTTDVARLAASRFAAWTHEVAREASSICAAWLAELPPPPAGECIASDASHAGSLLSRMRAAVGRLRLPFAVIASPTLGALAATGERAIFVASGRLLAEEDVSRTVVHEIDGHARPRARALHASSVLFGAGTARGIDDQEGRALLLEQRAGLLGPRRRRQLAARHRAVQAMLEGASFPDVVDLLVGTHGFEADDAVIVAERVFRGSDGERPGLGRERVYLESFVRVQAHLALHPEDERLLASGQVSIDALDALRPFAPE